MPGTEEPTHQRLLDAVVAANTFYEAIKGHSRRPTPRQLQALLTAAGLAVPIGRLQAVATIVRGLETDENEREDDESPSLAPPPGYAFVDIGRAKIHLTEARRPPGSHFFTSCGTSFTVSGNSPPFPEHAPAQRVCKRCWSFVERELGRSGMVAEIQQMIAAEAKQEQERNAHDG